MVSSSESWYVHMWRGARDMPVAEACHTERRGIAKILEKNSANKFELFVAGKKGIQGRSGCGRVAWDGHVGVGV